MEDAEMMGSDVQRAIELFGLPPHKTSFMTYWFDEWMDDEQLRRMLWASQDASGASTTSGSVARRKPVSAAYTLPRVCDLFAC